MAAAADMANPGGCLTVQYGKLLNERLPIASIPQKNYPPWNLTNGGGGYYIHRFFEFIYTLSYNHLINLNLKGNIPIHSSHYLRWV